MGGHQAQTNHETKKFFSQVGLKMRELDEHTPWANRAELYIVLFKEAVLQYLRLSHLPMVFWDYCMERRVLVHNAVLLPLFHNHGLTPHEATFIAQCDIYKFCQFTWYQWVYFRNPNSFPEAKEFLGQVLVPVNNEGSEMTQAILTSKSTIVICRSLCPLTTAEQTPETKFAKRRLFISFIKSKPVDSMIKPSKPVHTAYVPYADGNLDSTPLHKIDDDPALSDGTAEF